MDWVMAGEWGHMAGAWGWGMMIVWLLVLAILIVLVLSSSRSKGGSSSDGARPSSRAILEERFARGEIDAEEFRQRLAVLEGQ